MPFTSSRGFAAASTVLRLLAAVARDDLLLLGILLRRLLDERPQHLLVRLVVVRGVAPLLAVPRVDARLVRAAVVSAGRLQRDHHALHAERLQPRRVEGE